MPITKTAEQELLPEYLKRVFLGLGRKARAVEKKVRTIKYPAATGRAVLRGIAKPVTGLAKSIYNHPKVMVPGLFGLGLAGHYINKNLNKSLMHVDPDYKTTHVGVFPNIKYNDPRRTEEYNNLNPFFV